MEDRIIEEFQWDVSLLSELELFLWGQGSPSWHGGSRHLSIRSVRRRTDKRHLIAAFGACFTFSFSPTKRELRFMAEFWGYSCFAISL